MNDTMKAITVGVIILALYILLKHGTPTQNGPGTSAQISPTNVIMQSPCGTAIPMESANCAIPLAADYLPISFAHAPATAPISTRPIFSQPLDTQTCYAQFMGPVNAPYGTLGGTITPKTKPLAPCAFAAQDCVLTSCEPCAVKV